MTLAIPESTLIITCTAVFLSFCSNMATRLLVDLKRERRMRAEVAAFDKELREAISKKDKDKEEKLKKKKPQVDKMRLQMSTGRLKATFLTYIPFLLVYYFMASQLGGLGAIVARSPIPIPIIVSSSGGMALFWRYSLSSFSLTFGLQKLLGTSMSLP